MNIQDQKKSTKVIKKKKTASKAQEVNGNADKWTNQQQAFYMVFYKSILDSIY